MGWHTNLYKMHKYTKYTKYINYINLWSYWFIGLLILLTDTVSMQFHYAAPSYFPVRSIWKFFSEFHSPVFYSLFTDLCCRMWAPRGLFIYRRELVSRKSSANLTEEKKPKSVLGWYTNLYKMYKYTKYINYIKWTCIKMNL